jgi:hypothetical protein
MEERKLSPVVVGKKKWTVFCEKWSLILLASGMIALIIYAVLTAVFPAQ